MATTVPPVASKSSTIKTLSPSLTASLCIHKVFDPYSKSYFSVTTSRGSFPGFLIGTNPILSSYATGHPKIKPLDSGPTITVAPTFFANSTILAHAS